MADHGRQKLEVHSTAGNDVCRDSTADVVIVDDLRGRQCPFTMPTTLNANIQTVVPNDELPPSREHKWPRTASFAEAFPSPTDSNSSLVGGEGLLFDPNELR